MSADFEHRYDDLLELPHPEPDPKHHPRMSIADRAAQFAPFAALTGFDGVIDKTADQHLADQPEMYSDEEF